MPSNKNIKQLDNLIEKVKKSKSLALTDYRGLTVSQMTDLRQKVEEEGGELLVSKNTLLKLAFQKRGLPDDAESVLNGPTLALFSYEDEVAPLKTLVGFAKENELPTLKAGFLGKEFLNIESLFSLANIPSRVELQAKFFGQLSAPIYGFVNVLSGNIRNLIYVLNKIKDKKN